MIWNGLELQEPKIISRGKIRDAIANQVCPWCGKGKWRSLAVHTYYKHGVSASNLREMAFWYKGMPTCSSETAAIFRKIAIKCGYYRNLIGKNICLKRQMSEAGKAQRVSMTIATRERASKTLSQTRKRLFAEGKLKNPNPSKPHPCPICGRILPKAKPITCSLQCRHVLLHNAQAKAVQHRQVKVPRSEYPSIANRFRQGERSVIIAKEYGISPRFVRLISSQSVIKLEI